MMTSPTGTPPTSPIPDFFRLDEIDQQEAQADSEVEVATENPEKHSTIKAQLAKSIEKLQAMLSRVLVLQNSLDQTGSVLTLQMAKNLVDLETKKIEAEVQELFENLQLKERNAVKEKAEAIIKQADEAAQEHLKNTIIKQIHQINNS